MKNTNSANPSKSASRLSQSKAANLGRTVLGLLSTMAESPKLQKTTAPGEKVSVDTRSALDRIEWSGRPLI